MQRQIRWPYVPALVGLALIVSACVPAAQPTPTAAPAKPTTASAAPTEAAKPAASPAAASPAASPAAKPGASPAAAPAQPKPISQAESDRIWNELVAAARAEGKVVINTNTTGVRENMAPVFQRRFGIEAEVLVGRGSDAVRRVGREQAAGVVTIDVLIAGLSTTGADMYPQGMVPIKPMLVHPEVTDPAYWRDGTLKYMDPQGDSILRTVESIQNLITINTDFVNPAELRRSDDLLNPKWKSKISTYTVLNSGSGDTSWSFFMLNKGDDFVKRLWAQEPFQTDEDRPIEDHLVRGTYPIAMNMGEDDIAELQRQGFPIQVLWFEDLPPMIGAGGTHLVAVQGSPHPNATKLWANWFASKEGQTLFAKEASQPSRRVDVPTAGVPEFAIPKPGERTFDINSWDFSVVEAKARTERLNALLAIR